MSKFSLLIPLLTAVSAIAMMLNSASNPDEKRKRATGTILEADSGHLVLEQSGKNLSFSLTGDTKIHLNDRNLEAGQTSGRKATVLFHKRKGALVAHSIDIFPTPEDLA